MHSTCMTSIVESATTSLKRCSEAKCAEKMPVAELSSLHTVLLLGFFASSRNSPTVSITSDEFRGCTLRQCMMRCYIRCNTMV